MNIPWNDQIRNVPLTNGEIVQILNDLEALQNEEATRRHTPAASPSGVTRDRIIARLHSFTQVPR